MGFDMCGKLIDKNILNANPKPKDCSGTFNFDLFNKTFDNECLHKETCTLNKTTRFINSDDGQPTECKQPLAYMYLQVECTMMQKDDKGDW